jgi:hypothetical protein
VDQGHSESRRSGAPTGRSRRRFGTGRGGGPTTCRPGRVAGAAKQEPTTARKLRPAGGPPEAGRDRRHVSPPARPTQVVTAGRTARAATAGAGRRASQDLVDGVRRQRSCTCRVTGPPPCHGGRRNLSGCRTRRRPSPPVSPGSPLPAGLTPTGPSSNRLAACGVSWWAAPRKRALGGPVAAGSAHRWAPLGVNQGDPGERPMRVADSIKPRAGWPLLPVSWSLPPSVASTRSWSPEGSAWSIERL